MVVEFQCFEQSTGKLSLDPARPVILYLYASKLQAKKRCIDLVDAFLEIAE
jgi:hypothetical protein